MQVATTTTHPDQLTTAGSIAMHRDALDHPLASLQGRGLVLECLRGRAADVGGVLRRNHTTAECIDYLRGLDS